MAVDSAVLTVDRLSKRFDDLQAVDRVSFKIAPGETYGLLGPNGAGKTTTISMIAGLLERDEGSIEVAGVAMETTAVKAKRGIGLVPQELAIYPDLTGRENLAFFARLYGLSGPEMVARIDEVLDVIGLRDRATDRAVEYSGGMKRRLNIGIGMLHRPQLLILDEPTVGVDPQSRNAILDSVEQLAGTGMAVLYTTHYMEEAERLCDRVGIIDEGRVQAEGTRRELVALVGEKDRIFVGATGQLAQAVTAIQEIEGIAAASVADGGISIVAANGGAVLPQILATAAASGVGVTGVEIVEPDLEGVFLQVTGKALRD